MVDRGEDLGLALEAGDPVGVGGEGFENDLDRDLASEARVPRSVDLSHSPRAQRRQDLVGAEAGAGGDGHGVFPEGASRSSSENQFVTRWSCRTMPESGPRIVA